MLENSIAQVNQTNIMKSNQVAQKQKHTFDNILKMSLSYKAFKDHNSEKYLQTTFKKYIFPHFGFSTNDMKTSEFDKFCSDMNIKKLIYTLERDFKKEHNNQNNNEKKIDLAGSKLKDALLRIFDQEFEKALESGIVKNSTRYNYRSVLGRFCDFLAEQSWWTELFPEPIPEFIPYHQEKIRKTKKASNRINLSKYRLKENEFPSNLIEEIGKFKQFRLTGGSSMFLEKVQWNNSSKKSFCRPPKQSKIKKVTFLQNLHFTQLFFGWCVKVKGYDLANLRLELLTNARILYEYTNWCVIEKQTSHATGVGIAKAGIAIAKYLNYNRAEKYDWSDIDEIKSLREFKKYCDFNYEQQKKLSDQLKWQDKALTHPELEQVVGCLRNLCAEYSSRIDPSTGNLVKGQKRPSYKIFKSWQTFMLIKILTYLPVRQQEIRQFALNKTLFKKQDSEGKLYYEVKIIEYKNMSITGRPRRYRLPEIINADLDAFIILRSKAVEMVQTLEGWLKFYGYRLEELGRIQEQIKAAEQGKLPLNVKDAHKYILSLENRLCRLEKRIAAWEQAKANLAEHDSLFFSIRINKFGKPLSANEFCSIVKVGTFNTTQILFNKPMAINPHAFRNISEAHVRLNNGSKEAMAALQDHSIKEGDEYARRVLDVLDIGSDYVSTWWR